MIAAELLGHAQRILTAPSVDGLSSRIAAFLARQALEDIVEQRCAEFGVVAPRAVARSKLLVLRAFDSADAADRAAYAWNRLSTACHIHAYELQPSREEVEHLCAVVEALLDRR